MRLGNEEGKVACHGLLGLNELVSISCVGVLKGSCLRGIPPGGGAPGPPGIPKGGGIEPGRPYTASVSKCHLRFGKASGNL